MKPSKMETTLCERDALQDMLDAERLLMSEYALAIAEGSCRPLRRQLYKLCGEHADTQFSVLEQMLLRGYAQAQPAQQEEIGDAVQKFSKIRKQLS